jgi:hypothetical protein
MKDNQRVSFNTYRESFIFENLSNTDKLEKVLS